MKVASLDLCKELYKLSGWLGNSGVKVGIYNPGDEYDWWFDKYANPVAPKYDLGYLLRKLPGNYLLAWHDFADIAMEDGSIVVQGRAYALVTWGDDLDVWESFYDNTSQASTPEDAACKSTIELFNQGKLKK